MSTTLDRLLPEALRGTCGITWGWGKGDQIEATYYRDFKAAKVGLRVRVDLTYSEITYIERPSDAQVAHILMTL